ncbi:hypothetical protein KY289_023179 [Solanum tuberosum]|nr:hypothetical protein KY289_023179 [Solanum tuberosum]
MDEYLLLNLLLKEIKIMMLGIGGKANTKVYAVYQIIRNSFAALGNTKISGRTCKSTTVNLFR